ncbi:hypothetical protein BO83DRAFT_312449 [Aspergillus eucalypticola CBS 122712]|uniref:Glyoxalase/Bleomycin resistance protein/Dihydroxybiphenyl dioxygenase n=1 Tax=Aspergillus eucalypticola (strain CBS 122712 / IBT 29274) TaxID=1448314 RepID=A0A317VK50_ASPEC|nr:uncharacterized protein BO83DRAFT_312449 [Aspergillus eucalypticola CBS 122712]PWY73537.1 hypothetical protein BO83DRAFT_312449 [Aspergillus eucalypticola CBS 122712]
MSSTNILGNLNQVCIATPDFYKTLDELRSVGLGPFQVYRFNSDTVSDQKYYEETGDDLYEMDVAFAYNPDSTAPVIEVMHPKKGKSVIQDYLDNHGNKEGVQSIAYDMSTLTMDERIEAMKDKGYKPATSGYFIGKKGGTKFCFFDTADNDRVPTCFETIEWSSDWVAPDPEWYPNPPNA